MRLLSTFATSVAAFALFSGSPALAQGAAAQKDASTPTADSAPPKSPALWKISDEDTTIYLFGTVHLLPDNVEWYAGSIKEALESSQTLVTEVDLTPDALQSMSRIVQEKGILPPGQTLRGLMTEEQRTIYEGGLSEIGVPPGAFDQFEPWFASFAILQVVTQASGFTDDLGVESVLEKTVPEGTERIGLETIEYQLTLFDELPMEQQLAFLLDGAADPMEGIAVLNKLVTYWANGEIETLAELMNEGFNSHAILSERLLYERNENWANWIDDRMTEPGTVFMAVGAGHLAGEKSVQDYLTERGIVFKRVQ